MTDAIATAITIAAIVALSIYGQMVPDSWNYAALGMGFVGLGFVTYLWWTGDDLG